MLKVHTKACLRLIVLSSLLTAITALPSQARPTLRPSLEDFREQCEKNRSRSLTFARDQWAFSPQKHIGEITALPVGFLAAGQSLMSFNRVQNSLAKHGEGFKDHAPDVFFNRKKKRWILPFRRGRSLYPRNRAISGVWYRGRFFITDGHHRALSSLYFGAVTIPAQISEDLSALSEEDFFKTMEQRGLGYWRDPFGEPTTHQDLCQLIDDPNLYLARLLLRKVVVTHNGKKMQIVDKKGTQLPILLKLEGRLGKTDLNLPFIEFYIAVTLRRAGVSFDPLNMDSQLTYEKRREYLRILREAARDPTHPLSRVLLLARPTPVSELDVENLVFLHLKRLGTCELSLLL